MTGNGAGDDSSSGGGSGAALKKGPWTAAEDAILMDYVRKNGEGNWNTVQKNSGLSRCGKSCRLRWANHLRPNLKKGSFSPEEERLILELHAKLGNKWARMAAQLPGRTDNEIKNYWNTRIKRRQRAGLPLYPPDIQRQAAMNHHHQSSSPTPAKPNFASPLQLLDPITLSTTTTTAVPPSFVSPFNELAHPYLPLPVAHRFKRLRDTAAAGGISLPFLSPAAPSHILRPNSRGQHNNLRHPNHHDGYISFPFMSGNFDLDLPVLQQHSKSDGRSSLSFKQELPSSQLDEAGAHDYKSAAVESTPPDHCNSGLLDALLLEAQGLTPANDDRFPEPVGKCNLDVWLPPSSLPHLPSCQWDDSSSAQSAIVAKIKEERVDDMNSVDEDFSSLLDIMPPPIQPVPDWYSDSGEASNGQSGVSEEEIGLDMQQLACSLSAPNDADQDWSVASCPWNNSPGIC